MRYIGPVSSDVVQSAYLAKDDYVDESGFNPNDMRHPRWCHPVVPEDGAPGELEKRLTELGIEWEPYGGRDGVRASFDSTLLRVSRPGTLAHGLLIPRWPDSEGMYGIGTAPQYAIRSDMGRRTLDDVIASLQRLSRESREGGETVWKP